MQYFYTIKDLRDAVAPSANTNIKSLEDEKYSDDDLKKHRVGGRLISRREVLRSKKCKRGVVSFLHQFLIKPCSRQSTRRFILAARVL